MKAIFTILVLTITSLSRAQSQCVTVAAQIPICGVSCLSSAATAVGCAQTDLACQCSTSQSSAIQSNALDCIVKGCGAINGPKVSSSFLAVCSCVVNAAGGIYDAFPIFTTSYLPALYGSFPTEAQSETISTSTTSTTTGQGWGPPIVVPPGIVPFPGKIPEGPDEPGEPDPTKPTTTTGKIPTTTVGKTTSYTGTTTSGTGTTTSTSTMNEIQGTVYEAFYYEIDRPAITSAATKIYAIQLKQACMTPTTSYSVIGSVCSTSNSTSTSTRNEIQGTVYEAWYYAIDTAAIMSAATQIYAIQLNQTCMTPTTSYSVIGSVCSTSTMSEIQGNVYEAWYYAIDTADLMSAATQIYAIQLMQTCMTPTTSYSVIGSVCSSTTPPPAAPTTAAATTTPELPPPVTTTTSSEPSQTSVTQSCKVIDRGLFATYIIEIIGLYVSQSDCDAAKQAVNDGTGRQPPLPDGRENHGTDATSWICNQYKDGTVISFNSDLDRAAEINTSLESRFPNVSGGFNCGNY